MYESHLTCISMVSEEDVVVVTVTYGNRWQYLERVISACASQGIKHFIIANNNEDVSQLQDFDNLTVSVIECGKNLGSAEGFNRAIAQARLFYPSHFIWLLDDDNLPELNSLGHLLFTTNSLLQSRNTDFIDNRFILLSYRPDHISEDIIGRNSIKDSRFYGFDLISLIKQRFRRKAISHFKKQALDDFLNIRYAPYGGLFFPVIFVDQFGLPETKYFLYGDDTDYSYKMRRSGFQILLVKDSLITDIDKSWNRIEETSSFTDRMINEKSIFRLYYSLRNQTYFDTKVKDSNKSILYLNMSIFVFYIFLKALSGLKFRRIGIFFLAIKHGLLEEMGENENFNGK